MATKTISLELDAYDKLRAAKRSGESFSQVVRRSRIEAEPATGAALLARLAEWRSAGLLPDEKTFDYWADAGKEDAAVPRISPNAWVESDRP